MTDESEWGGQNPQSSFCAQMYFKTLSKVNIRFQQSELDKVAPCYLQINCEKHLYKKGLWILFLITYTRGWSLKGQCVQEELPVLVLVKSSYEPLIIVLSQTWKNCKPILYSYTHVSVPFSRLGCGTPDSVGTSILFRFVFSLLLLLLLWLTEQLSQSAVSIINLISSSPIMFADQHGYVFVKGVFVTLPLKSLWVLDSTTTIWPSWLSIGLWCFPSSQTLSARWVNISFTSSFVLPLDSSIEYLMPFVSELFRLFFLFTLFTSPFFTFLWWYAYLLSCQTLYCCQHKGINL